MIVFFVEASGLVKDRTSEEEFFKMFDNVEIDFNDEFVELGFEHQLKAIHKVNSCCLHFFSIFFFFWYTHTHTPETQTRTQNTRKHKKTKQNTKGKSKFK